MPKGKIFGLDRPFVEEEEDTIKIIAEYSDIMTSGELANETQLAIGEIESKGFVIPRTRLDVGNTSFFIIEMATNNIEFHDLNQIRNVLMETDGFMAMTVSTVDLTKVSRLARKR